MKIRTYIYSLHKKWNIYNNYVHWSPHNWPSHSLKMKTHTILFSQSWCNVGPTSFHVTRWTNNKQTLTICVFCLILHFHSFFISAKFSPCHGLWWACIKITLDGTDVLSAVRNLNITVISWFPPTLCRTEHPRCPWGRRYTGQCTQTPWPCPFYVWSRALNLSSSHMLT